MAFAFLLAVSAVPSGAGNLCISGVNCEYLRYMLATTEEPDPIKIPPTDDHTIALTLVPESKELTLPRPHVAFDELTGQALVVYCAYVGPDYDIAFTERQGEGWEPIQFLSSTGIDDLDPRVAVGPDGTAYVVWWQRDRDTGDRVMLTRRSAETGEWEPPSLITIGGRRPSVAVVEDQLVVVYERTAAEVGQQIMVYTEWTLGLPVEETVVVTDRIGPLSPMVHSANGRIWLDWRNSDWSYSYLEQVEGVWDSTPVVLPLVDDSWLGVELVRRTIETQILAP